MKKLKKHLALFLSTSMLVSSLGSSVYGSEYFYNNDTVWTWGQNAHGSVGNGTTVNQLTPYKVMDNIYNGWSANYDDDDYVSKPIVNPIEEKPEINY